MKPVAAGLVPWGEDWASEDAIALRSASTLAVPPALDNPVLLPDPLSPHIAAARAGVEIDIAAIVASYQALAAQADAVVVEGAGGFHVPAAQVAQPRTAQVKEIQERLSKLGYPMDKHDGKIGSNTRRQVGTYQKTSGLKIDCWPTEAVLSHLRSNAAREAQ